MVLASVGDPTGERTVTAIVALLVVIGVGLVMLAIWLFRVTRPDPEVLAPLETMGSRSWRRADPVWQRRRLDEVRPAGAQPLQPSVAPPEIDAAFDDGPAASGFDDLHDAASASIPGDPLVVNGSALPAPDADATSGLARRPGLPYDPPPAAARSTLPQRPRVVVVPAQGLQAPPAPAAHEPVPDVAVLPPPVRSGDASSDIDPALLAAAVAELDAELATAAGDVADGDPPSGDVRPDTA